MLVTKERTDWSGHFNWICEKWSEEAVQFARKRLEYDGVEYLLAGYDVRPSSKIRDRIASKLVGRDVRASVLVPRFIPIKEGITSEQLRKIVGKPEEIEEIEGNLLLNEGIQRLQDLSMIATPLSNQVATNPWSNGNAYLGVGDSSTAEAATQSELQAATNRFYKAMNATFPSRTNQTVSFQSDFISSEANFAWNEWSVAAGATTASGGGFTNGTTNLNRKVAALGTKSTGTWTLTGQITLS